MDGAATEAHPFTDELAAFDLFGTPTTAFVDNGIPYYVNEFWTARQRSGHSLHEISYRACFKPQLPEFFINRLTAPREAVCDPFLGRGTTALQATLQGRRAFGSDANPLSIMLTRPRLRPPPLEAIAARLDQAPWKALRQEALEREDLLAFYHPETLRELSALRAWLIARHEEKDAVDDWIRMVALNRLTGHSPGFFSVYTMPPNQAVSVDAQRKINARRAQTPPPRNIPALILKKSRALLKDGAPPETAARLEITDAGNLRYIVDRAVDLVVTSPPFLDVVDYRSDNWLRNWFTGVEDGAARISQLRDPRAWSEMTRSVFTELARVVRPGGHVAYEVGEVRGGGLLLERLVWSALKGLPFERLCVVVNQQSFTKTSNCWGVANNSKGVNSNRIVLARRM